MGGTSDLGQLRIRLEMPLTDFQMQMQKAKTGMKDFGGAIVRDLDRAKEGLSTLGMALGAISASIGVVGGIAVKNVSSFQHQMAEVSTIITQDSEKWTKQLSSDVLELSRTMPRSTDLLTRGLYDLLSAMIPVEDSMADLKLSTQAAVAGLTDVQSAVKLGAATMNGLGKSAGSMKEVFDTAFETVRIGVITFPELASTMGQVIPSASKLGVSMKEMYGSMAFLTKTGLDAAEASVSLARAFDQIIEKRPALEGLGVKIFGKQGEFLGFQKVMEQIAKITSGLSAEKRANIFEEMGFDIRASRAITNISMNIQGFKSDLDSVNKSAGALDTAYSKMADTTTEKTQILKNNVKALSIEFGESLLPAVNAGISGLTRLVGSLNDLPKPLKDVISYGGLAVGALSGIGSAGILLASQIPNIVKGLIGLKDAIETVRIAAMLAAPELAVLGLAAGAVASMAAIAIYGKHQMEEGMKPINAMADSLAAQEKAIKQLEDAQKKAKEKGLDPYAIGISDLNDHWNNYNVTMRQVEAAFGKGELSLKSLGNTLDDAKAKLEGNRKAYWILQNSIISGTSVVEESTKATKEQAAALDQVGSALSNKNKAMIQSVQDYKDWIDISGAGYKASLGEQLAKLAKLRDALPKTGKDYREVVNTMNDLSSKAMEELVSGQQAGFDLILKARNDFIKQISLEPIILPSGEVEQPLKPRITPLPKEQAGLMEEKLGRSVESVNLFADAIARNKPKMDMLGAIMSANAETAKIQADEIDRNSMILDDAMRNSWDPFYNILVDYNGELEKSQQGYDNWNKSLDMARKIVDPLGATIADIHEKYKAFYEYADEHGLDKALLQEAEAIEIERAMDDAGKEMNKVQSDYDDLINDLKESKPEIKSWYESFTDGVTKIEGAFDTVRSLVNIFSNDTRVSMQDWAGQIKSIAEQYAQDTSGVLDQEFQDYLSQQKGLGVSLADAIKTWNDEMTADTKRQKDEELKVIEEYQKSKLSGLDQEKIAINDNYTELKLLYQKYGMDTVGLERDRQKALKDLEIEGFTNSLDRIANYVEDAKTIWNSLIDTWELAIDVYNRFIKTSSQTPSLSGVNGGQGGGIGLSNVPSTISETYGPTNAELGIGTGTAVGARAVGSKAAGPLMVATALYDMNRMYRESMKAGRERIRGSRRYVTGLQEQIGQGTITGEQANLAFFKQQYAAGYPVVIINGKKYTHEQLGELIAFLEGGGSPSASYATPKYPTANATQTSSLAPPANANLAPSANININFDLTADKERIDALTRDVELSARKQGFRVTKNNYA